MSITLVPSGTDNRGGEADELHFARVIALLRQHFSESVALWNAETGEPLVQPVKMAIDESYLSPLVPVVARKGHPELVLEIDSLCVLAIPLRGDEDQLLVATAPFLIGAARDPQLPAMASSFGCEPREFADWAAQQIVWPTEALLKFGRSIQALLAANTQIQKTEREIDLVSENLASTYEEISLLYTVTKNLRISSTDEELGRLALGGLEECLRAESFAMSFLPVGRDEAGDEDDSKSRTAALYLQSADCPLDESQFAALIEHLELSPAGGACVVNHRATQEATWPFPEVRQLIIVPLVEGNNVFGWLAAFNQRHGESFGTIESNLLASLGTLLGIHCGNRDLYRQQSELLRNIVRALVSAIDAKDPYTSGHSDRVARFAVRLALELKCSPKFINTIYMAGLLHDVGKIGIDDSVLRKAGRLNDVEFAHIKRHPELGHKILADLRQLSDVLPAVLHHHEQWDGAGYPHGIAGDGIPLIARIMAVADAYDAMTSDRPYRMGMPEATVQQIFRDGCGKFWDPQVVDAFFRANADIQAIAQRERAQVDAFQQHLL